ncbi:MAG: hypothetical protein AABY22_09320 [Nanoarchaeota archaeon]
MKYRYDIFWISKTWGVEITSRKDEDPWMTIFHGKRKSQKHVSCIVSIKETNAMLSLEKRGYYQCLNCNTIIPKVTLNKMETYLRAFRISKLGIQI